MASVEIMEVTIEQGGKRVTEYVVNPGGLVIQTKLRVLGRAFQNLLYNSLLDNDPEADALKHALDAYLKKHHE